MDFSLTKEQEFVKQMVREFTINEVEPIAAEIDRTERFPTETVEKMARYHMLGIPISTEFGGAGGDNLSYAIAVEELSKSLWNHWSYNISSHFIMCRTNRYVWYIRAKEKILSSTSKG